MTGRLEEQKDLYLVVDAEQGRTRIWRADIESIETVSIGPAYVRTFADSPKIGSVVFAPDIRGRSAW